MKLTFILVVVAAYLMGSLSFAVIVSRLMHLQDPRSYGSGNPGATNVLRSGNKLAAVLTLIFDALKGLIAVFLVKLFSSKLGLGEFNANAVALVGIAAFLGHLFPIFFRFRGGKGVATAAGVLIAWSWPTGILTIATWIILALVLRYSSLAALTAALACAPIYYTGSKTHWWEMHWPIFWACCVMSVLLIWRHRLNIRRLLKGQEPRIGKK